MSERPLLIFPDPRTAVKQRRGGRPPSIKFPSPVSQRDRLEPKFAQLQRAFDARRVELREGIAGIEPEQVLVLETVGSIEDFFKALKGIDGLEWLAELNEDNIPSDEDFYKNDDDKESDLSGRLYLIMSNQRGLRELLSLWEIFQNNPDHAQFKRGRAKWGKLFKQLKDIRCWGPEDRLRETGLLEDWKERSQAEEERVRIEIELWYRSTAGKQKLAEGVVTRLVKEANGQVLGRTLIEEIAYHALLAEMPIQSVEALLTNTHTRLVQSDQVMFFRPVGQTISIIPDDEPLHGTEQEKDFQVPINDPVVALFDGLPLENHRRLAGRLLVDDPEDWASAYPATDRHHGTAMASLILNGDLNAGDNSLSRPIYVRPILKPTEQPSTRPRREIIPENILPVDLIHRSVRRLFEGEGSEPPAAPSVRIINLSIGIQGRLFDSALSPLARLLDYLAWKYRVLFIVSAGNHPNNIELDVPRVDFTGLAADPVRLQEVIFRAVEQQARFRRLLSPAESINAITVGAVHEDLYNTLQLPNRRINPYKSSGLPSPINAQGFGFRRSIKPDVLFSGGRQTYSEKLGNTHSKATLLISQAASPPGQLVASPGTIPSDLGAVRNSCGTSNATALATRTAAFLFEVLQELRDQPGGDRLNETYFSVLIKSLLAHGAGWRDTRDLVWQLLGKKDKNVAARLLGYGQVQPDRISACADHRATLIGFGSLTDGQAHLYSIPIPPSINGQRVWRRLTATLAWLTPINCKHNAYRRAALWFAPYGEALADNHFNKLLQVKRQEVDGRVVTRGTVQHEVFEGDKAAVFSEGSELQIHVNCRADAGDLEDDVPYGLVFTLEVAESINLPIYQEISTLIRPRIGINPVLGDLS